MICANKFENIFLKVFLTIFNLGIDNMKISRTFTSINHTIKMKTALTFEIANTQTVITRTTVFNSHKTELRILVSNEALQHTILNYVKSDDVVTMSVTKRGNKAADMLFLLSRKIEQSFEVASEFIKGEYLAIVSKPKMIIL